VDDSLRVFDQRLFLVDLVVPVDNVCSEVFMHRRMQIINVFHSSIYTVNSIKTLEFYMLFNIESTPF